MPVPSQYGLRRRTALCCGPGAVSGLPTRAGRGPRSDSYDSDIKEVSAERPRWYYLTIDSADVPWRVTVDERIDAQVKGSP